MSLTIRDRDNKDDRLITMTTPKETARSYKRIFDPTTGVAPKSERILQDVNKVVHALQVIYEAEGVYVPGLAGRSTPSGLTLPRQKVKKQEVVRGREWSSIKL